MKLEGAVQQADQIAFLQVANRRQWTIRRQLAYVASIVGLVLAVVGILAARAPSVALSDAVLAALVGWAVFHFLQRAAYRFFPPLPMGDFSQGNNTITVELGTDELIVQSPDMFTRVRWDRFDDVRVYNGTIMLFTSPGHAVIIPRGAFQNEQERLDVMDLINQRIEVSTTPQSPEHL